MPPEFPDVVHVTNGCYLSSVAYLARFARAFPNERGDTLTLFARAGSARATPHTVALVTWQGTWWLRDEYLGVASLRLPVAPGVPINRIAERALVLCERSPWDGGAERRRTSGATPPLDSEQRLLEVLIGATLIPFPSDVFQLRVGCERVPLLFFIPRTGAIAVYDPAHGTALAESNSADGGRVVALVAERLGYKVDAVERHCAATGASATPNPGSAAP